MTEAIDQDELAKKLQNYIESTALSNGPSPRHHLCGLSNFIRTGPSPPVEGSETEGGG